MALTLNGSDPTGDLGDLLGDLGDDLSVLSDSLDTKVTGTGIINIVALTQAEYDALTPVATTLYVVTD